MLANTGAGFWGSWAALAGGALVGIGGALMRLTRGGVS
ncbi:LPXTG cell wall anchor domain-containing protein [Actinospica durhamensis]|uniref:LPXTG cell wall anchor domain-containing protein n=1 Tax=Actinospica durhamensis TaxID=1508375 RepID=A0A941EUH6_9ACTN|nr:LPXTG cell wall anchor domain-containing protein [Actinospica durhamensis]MBR7838565.1 LPXTG cell wall anchor domain-containing protein [Actinospica durhamensis]